LFDEVKNNFKPVYLWLLVWVPFIVRWWLGKDKVEVSDIRPRYGSGGHVVNDGKWHNLATEKTNEELLTILNEKRDDYNLDFIRAAEMEIEKRSRSEN